MLVLQTLKSKLSILDKLKSTKVLQNYSYMSALNIVSALVGFLVYPYVIRTLGAENYGLYAFLLAIALYFQDFIDFGFDSPCTKRVALSVGDKAEMSRIVSTVLYAKFLLILLSLLIALPLVLCIPVLRQNFWLFAIIFVQNLYKTFYPQWYYLGTKNMKFSSILQAVIRVSQIPFILIFVKSPEDLLIYAAIISGTMFVGSLVGGFNVLVEGIRLVRVSFSQIKSYYKEALPFFVTTISGRVKEKTLTAVVGAFFGMKEVAIYDLACKLIQIPKLLLNSINAALFPEVVTKATPERVNKILKVERLIALATILLIVLFGYPATLILGGRELIAAYPVAVILSLTIYFMLITGAYLQFVFVANGLYRHVALNQLLALLSCLLFCAIGMLVYPSVWAVALSLSLSCAIETLYCRLVSCRFYQSRGE
ncbi:MAG: oligosaccharide flippase family protein [Candidatus Cryptobacteroides sp.]